MLDTAPFSVAKQADRPTSSSQAKRWQAQEIKETNLQLTMKELRYLFLKLGIVWHRALLPLKMLPASSS